MSARRESVLPRSLAPRGLSREQAAEYVGVGTTKFDAMVTDGRMPRPKRIDGRVVWDREALDSAFAALPDDGTSPNDGEAEPNDGEAEDLSEWKCAV